MPAPNYPYRVVLRPETLDLMAEAIGDAARTGFGGQPSKRILLGTNATGTASALISGKNDPSTGAMATIGARLAAASGMTDWDEDAVWAAIRKTHRIVAVPDAAMRPGGRDEPREAAAAVSYANRTPEVAA